MLIQFQFNIPHYHKLITGPLSRHYANVLWLPPALMDTVNEEAQLDNDDSWVQDANTAKLWLAKNPDKDEERMRTFAEMVAKVMQHAEDYGRELDIRTGVVNPV